MSHAYNEIIPVTNNSLPNEGRILALDLGRRRIGLALSDELRLTAQGLETFQRTNMREDLDGLARIVNERSVTLILLGNPIHMSGNEGAQSGWVRHFASKLQARTGCEIRFWDERLTTAEAERVLRASGISRQKRSKAVDRLAAVILLQSYLESVDAEDELE